MKLVGWAQFCADYAQLAPFVAEFKVKSELIGFPKSGPIFSPQK
jgi:hypothetical protein